MLVTFLDLAIMWHLFIFPVLSQKRYLELYLKAADSGEQLCLHIW